VKTKGFDRRVEHHVAHDLQLMWAILLLQICLHLASISCSTADYFGQQGGRVFVCKIVDKIAKLAYDRRPVEFTYSLAKQ